MCFKTSLLAIELAIEVAIRSVTIAVDGPKSSVFLTFPKYIHQVSMVWQRDPGTAHGTIVF